MSQLESLKKHTIIVADTGDFNLIAKYKPTDSTTNPSLIKNAVALPQYQNLLKAAIEAEKSSHEPLEVKVNRIIDRLIVLFGVEILKLIPGKVSVEMDAKLAFDTEGMVDKGIYLLDLFSEYGINSDRVYLKLPTTWEGIQAASQLKMRSSTIHVNMTLIFSIIQAIACADVGADLISPFVGRITDFYKNNKGMKIDNIDQDPGVLNVKKIYNYFQTHGIKTILMGASFRNIDQIKALCGIPALTISPKLLEELNNLKGEVKPLVINDEKPEKIEINEQKFRDLMSADEMASFKLQEGIRLFAEDTEQLREAIKTLISQKN